ncbi:hypothetical protein BpHYR1_038108 [Brachionus plicatilis]|uniref:Uncharacterized protein n=1 Tax=Brachionus plicatilis TaxID=10195 RepID=A0A3M7Q375_BRAPC|nr:hypothetical protein BpHYR1_038108 [Brachionus plicatilis]
MYPVSSVILNQTYEVTDNESDIENSMSKTCSFIKIARSKNKQFFLCVKTNFGCENQIFGCQKTFPLSTWKNTVDSQH